MRHVRTATAAATILSLLAALASGPATAATSGVGTATGETTVIGVDLGADGSLLGVRLLADDARSTIDPKTAAAAEAFSRFTSVSVSSALVSALNKADPTLESRQPGGEKEVTRGSVDLSHPSTDPDVPIPSSVVSGTLGFATLSSEAASTAAKSSLTAELSNASLAGALTTVRGVSSKLTTSASSTASETTRSVKVDQVVVLDLSALLEGLDLSLLDLDLSVIYGLLDTLDVPVPDVGGAADVEAVVADLNEAVDAVQAELDNAETLADLTGTTTVDTIVDVVNNSPLGELIGDTTETTLDAIPDPAAQLTAVIVELNTLLDELQKTLSDLLIDVLDVLEGTPLLTVDGAEASVVTKAADTVANSVATRTAKVGSVSVGSRVVIPGVDLAAATTTVDESEALIDATISGVTNGIDPGLAGLVDVDLFTPVDDPGVSTANGYVKATEGVTVMTVKVTPPAALATIVDTVHGAVDPSIAEEIDTYGGDAPDLAPQMKELKTTLGGTTDPVAEGGTFRIAQVLGTSEFAPGAAGFPGSGINPAPAASAPGSARPGNDTGRSLPATGSNTTLPMTAFAVLLVALGLGFRQWTHMPVPARVRGFRLPTRTR